MDCEESDKNRTTPVRTKLQTGEVLRLLNIAKVGVDQPATADGESARRRYGHVALLR